VNRLSIWSVGQLRRMLMKLQMSAGSSEALTAETGPTLSTCRLQFDINSDALRNQPLEPRDLIPLLEEFVDLAREIAERGDIP
jgi:hypothetical protein